MSNSSGIGHLQVDRPSGHYRDAIRQYGIYINGQLRGNLGAGKTLHLELPPGTHDVQAKIDWLGSEVIAVTVEAGLTVKMVAKPNGFPLLALLQLFEPESWIRLSTLNGD